MKKIKYLVLIPVCSVLFSCSDTDMSSTSGVNNTGDTFQAHIENVSNDEKYGENSIYHDSFLMIEDGTEQYTYELRSSYSDELHMCDIDGDNKDEIVINQLVGISGGAGQYQSYIFKYENNEIVEMFNSVTGNKFDTGFSSVLKDNYKVEISNDATGYKTEIDYFENPMYYNNDGTVNEDRDRDWLMVDSFREFKPEDIDNDGIYEISCLQYSSLCGHMDFIGNAQSYLKYNCKKQEFEIIQAQFNPYIRE